MSIQDIVGEGWQSVLKLLPEDLDESAVEFKALQRKRGIASAGDLLRLGLAYALGETSLAGISRWAEGTETGYLSRQALFKRLRNAGPWFEHILSSLLQDAFDTIPGSVQLIDATSLSIPGSSGTDWRVHLNFNLNTQRMVEAKLTEASTGESLNHFSFQPGSLVIADRIYGRPQEIANIQDAQVIIRMKCSHSGLRDLNGKPFELLKELVKLKQAERGDYPVQLFSKGKYVCQGRLIAVLQSEAAAGRARKKINRKAQRNSRKASLTALEAANYIFVFTNLPAQTYSPQEILNLYRFRWQVELCFKRLKSLIALDDLPMKDPALCRSFLALKLIAALIIEKLIAQALTFSPSTQTG